jgi:hypothetical protein
VLKSRRGLLAAGLAVVVVGALGVASTLNAGAEQITGASDQQTAGDQQPVAAAPASSADDASTPPALLPWGARPERVRKGRAGVSARTLRTDGLDAASNDTSGSIMPRGRYAPKGDLPKGNSFRYGARPAAAPSPEPEPSTSPDNKNCEQLKQPCYLYEGAQQQAETDGMYVNVTIGKPKLDDSDYHTLGELAVRSAEKGDVVEVGWTIDRQVNGDEDPHLFVYHWVGHQESCYNGCGFVQYSKNLKPGDTLSYGVTKKFGIQYFNGAWWVAFDSEWIGYFPEQLWNDQGIKFSRTGWVQVFGEVASPTLKPCSTGMGTGEYADKSAAAYMASISYLNGPAVAPYIPPDGPAFYPVAALSPRTFRYGGPGYCPWLAAQ